MRNKYKAALLLIDFFNPMDFEGGAALARAARRAAGNAALLKARLREAGVPAIYANDNFGHWESEFSALVSACRELRGAPGEIARLLAPDEDDRSILKPRHSAFYGTPLEFLLASLGVDRLILAGQSTDSCIAFTAQDAYVRKFALWIPDDCVAAEKPEYSRAALVHMQRVLKADVDKSTTSLRILERRHAQAKR
jgi:nicotinamidase-related amidase